ncbi:MAG: transcriptional regulator, partial [Acidobacteria bacterium]|nr:transcriptional regulator [Acidobacteriota bacterium]
MKATKRKRLEAAGWSVGSAEDFLELSPVEAALVELKLR